MLINDKTRIFHEECHVSHKAEVPNQGDVAP